MRCICITLLAFATLFIGSCNKVTDLPAEKFPGMDKARVTAMHKWQHSYYGDKQPVASVDTQEFALVMPTDSTIYISIGGSGILSFLRATDSTYMFRSQVSGSGASRDEFTYNIKTGEMNIDLIVAHYGYYVNSYVAID